MRSVFTVHGTDDFQDVCFAGLRERASEKRISKHSCSRVVYNFFGGLMIRLFTQKINK